MRLKKFLLLYCAGREWLLTTAFSLLIQPYQVSAVEESGEVVFVPVDRCTTVSCGVLIHAQQNDLAGRPIHRLLVDHAGGLAPIRCADLVLCGRNITMAHVLASLRVICRPKPEPRPQAMA